MRRTEVEVMRRRKGKLQASDFLDGDTFRDSSSLSPTPSSLREGKTTLFYSTVYEMGTVK